MEEFPPTKAEIVTATLERVVKTVKKAAIACFAVIVGISFAAVMLSYNYWAVIFGVVAEIFIFALYVGLTLAELSYVRDQSVMYDEILRDKQWSPGINPEKVVD